MARNVFEQSGIEVECMHGQRPAQIDAVAGQQSRLERDERCRRGCPDRRSENGSGVGVDPAGHVERQDRHPGGIGPIDQGGIVGRRGTRESDAEQAIDDQCSLPARRERGRRRASAPRKHDARQRRQGATLPIPGKTTDTSKNHSEATAQRRSVAPLFGTSQQDFARAFACHRARDFRCRRRRVTSAVRYSPQPRSPQFSRSKNDWAGRMHGWKL
jgi:hypothetical protein